MGDSPQERGCRWFAEVFGYWSQGGVEVGRFLPTCPPHEVKLPTLEKAAESWHHLANQLTDEVFMVALHAAYRVDEPNPFIVPTDYAEVVGRAQGNPQRYWPAIAKALCKFKLVEFEAEQLEKFLEAEWTSMAAAGNGRADVHSLIRDGCRHVTYLLFAAHAWGQREAALKPVHLDYLVEVARKYLDTVNRVENAKAKADSNEAIVGLENHRDTLGRELVGFAQWAIDRFTGDVEQVEEWRRMEKPADPAKLAMAVVRQLAGDGDAAPQRPQRPRHKPRVRRSDGHLMTGGTFDRENMLTAASRFR